jgi:dipeptidyl aminopeptidase/acylaminoacyl peptidase
VQFATAAIGDALWAPGASTVAYRLVWIDADGSETPLDLPPAPFNEAAAAPDGRFVAVVGGEEGLADLWLFDIARQARSRLTTGEFVSSPVWSPDSKRIAYSTRARENVANRWRIVWKEADGSRDAEVLVEGPRAVTPSHLTLDGEELIYDAIRDDGNAIDVYALPLAGSRESRLILGGRTTLNASVSPDGRWLAYVEAPGNQSPMVFVRPYQSGDGRFQISTPLGLEPRWSPDGRALYYRWAGRLYRVAIDTARGFSASRPEPLADRVATGVFSSTYTPLADGRVLTWRSPQEESLLRMVHFELGFARRLAEQARAAR